MPTHVLDAFARDWLARYRAAGGLAYADPTSNGRGYVLTSDGPQQARTRHLIGMLHGTVGAQAALARILADESTTNLTKPDIAPSPFDPDEWLAAWSDNGGLAVLVHDRLYLGRTKALDQHGNECLDQLRAQLISSGAWDAVTETLRHGMLMEAE